MTDKRSEATDDGAGLHAAIAALSARVSPTLPCSRSLIDEAESLTFAALRAGIEHIALGPLHRLVENAPSDAKAQWLLGTVLRAMQQHEEALVAFERAAALAPNDPRASTAVAQLRFETGRPAADAFRSARAMMPNDDRLLRNLAGAIAAEESPIAAEALITEALRKRPGWIEGQTYLATLRILSGDHENCDAGFADACAAEPGNLAQRLAWFHLLSKARLWDRAEAVVRAAVTRFGNVQALEIARLFIASESGREADNAELFAAVANRIDPGLDLCRIRHALRGGRPKLALALTDRHIPGPTAAAFWPYRALAWRLLKDERALWLDRPDQFIRSIDIGLTATELDGLAELLRGLHTASAPYHDQSVRGGTQTDRPLLFRHEPIVRRTREAIVDAVQTYVAALPPHEAEHPLLSTPRDDIRFAGSWSARLEAQGYHACHTHPAGWISSALHIVAPNPPGPEPAGWLQFGTPPPELGLDLPVYKWVQPKPGQLTLFPSTLWHGTVPFDGGERLSIAFDIRTPRY